MRNINIQKIANILSVVVVTMILVAPLLTAAQFQTPDAAAPGAGGSSTGLPNESSATAIIVRVIQILLAVAGLVAVVFLIIGGFRYITAGGNEESAEAAKTTITNAIIGIVIIILSFVIVRVISNALTKTGSTGATIP